MQEPRHVLVIEDDPDIAQMLALNLRDEGYLVALEHEGEAGLARLRHERHHLLILDLMLPGMDGWSVCREVRQMPDYVPIIIVSAKDKESHRVLGLELGADDYVTKPFSLPELVARVRAVLRRMDAAEQLAATRAGMIRRGGLTIDPLAREARLRGESVTLTAREFDLLLFFARNPDRVFNRMELLDQVWGYSHDGYEHTVNSHINRLRMKIEANPARPVSILTVWGVGYKFVAAPEES
ncbi:MAG TPA: response regulator transcription factor [Casimicrobiaceae bacterium]